MLAFILITFLAATYASAAPWVQNEDIELLSREERATALHFKENEPEEYLGCAVGHFFLQEDEEGTRFRCERCPIDTYTRKVGFYKNCTACPPGENTPPNDNSRCSEPCQPGFGWNRTASRCNKCEIRTYKDSVGFSECMECPPYHNSTRGAVQCLLECPKGMEPNTLPDGSATCSSCAVGFYNRKAGKKGVNQECLSCCDGDPACVRNWTLTIGADTKQECIRLPKKVATCFPYLVTALARAAPYIDDEVEREKRLLVAFCRSDTPLESLIQHYGVCSQLTVKKGGVDVVAIPKLRTNGSTVLDMEVDFNVTMSCLDVTTTPNPTHTPTFTPTPGKTSVQESEGSTVSSATDDIDTGSTTGSTGSTVYSTTGDIYTGSTTTGSTGSTVSSATDDIDTGSTTTGSTVSFSTDDIYTGSTATGSTGRKVSSATDDINTGSTTTGSTVSFSTDDIYTGSTATGSTGRKVSSTTDDINTGSTTTGSTVSFSTDDIYTGSTATGSTGRKVSSATDDINTGSTTTGSTGTTVSSATDDIYTGSTTGSTGSTVYSTTSDIYTESTTTGSTGSTTYMSTDSTTYESTVSTDYETSSSDETATPSHDSSTDPIM